MAAHEKAPRAGGAGTNLVDRNHITAERLAKALDGRRSGEGWEARCPAHDDRKPSLSINKAADGQLLVHCHAGCSQEAVIEALQSRGLWPGGSNGLASGPYPASGPSPALWENSEPPPLNLRHRSHGEPSGRWEIRNPEGQLFAVHCRFDLAEGTKSFAWWRAGKWSLGGLKAADAPLYRSEQVAGFDLAQPIFVTEGEKSCDALAGIQAQAVATVTGASSTPNKGPLEILRGCRVVLWPDNDEAGRQHMQRVGESLVGIAASIEVIDSQSLDLPDGGDAREWVDWWDAKDTEAIFEELHRLHRMPIECRGKPLASYASYEPVVVRMSDVEAEEISWLWYPRIARSKLTVLEGDPGVGKSFVTAAVATAVSLGKGLPGCDETEPGTVLMLTAEDGLGDTLRPRLDLLSADVGRILACEHALDFSTDDGREFARQQIAEYRPSVVTIDPIVAYVGAGTDTHRANQVRSILAPLAAMASAFGCAILVVRHLNKSSTSKSIYRGQGSIDFTAAARSVLLAGADPDDQDRKALVQLKSNLGPLAPSLGYEIQEGRFQWSGESTLTASDLLGGEASEQGRGATEEAQEFLLEVLGQGRVPAKEVKQQAKEAGVAERTLTSAKRKLGVKSRRDGFGGGGTWYWELPK